jgi:hypothetical protein
VFVSLLRRHHILIRARFISIALVDIQVANDAIKLVILSPER